MDKRSGHRAARLPASVAGVTMAAVLALVGCGSSPGASAHAASTPASSRAAGHATASPAAKTGAPPSSVVIPKYVASENARQEVTISSCKRDGAKRWLLRGLVANASSSVHGYSIVVDFVSSKGDTVLDTKIIHVRRVAPKTSAHWAAIGAAARAHVSCVIRQALDRG